jgi:hypothetical protein
MKLRNLGSENADILLRLQNPFSWVSSEVAERVIELRPLLLQLKLSAVESLLQHPSSNVDEVIARIRSLIVDRVAPAEVKFLASIEPLYDADDLGPGPSGGLRGLVSVVSHVLAERSVGLYHTMSDLLEPAIFEAEVRSGPLLDGPPTYAGLLLLLPANEVERAVWRYRSLKPKYDESVIAITRRLMER